MHTDRNLLFGVMALQADLINSRQFVDVCSVWASRKTVSLADLLIEQGWIQATDRDHVEYLLERKLEKHGGDASATLASVPDEVRRSLAVLEGSGIQRSLADLPMPPASDSCETIDVVPDVRERYKRIHLHATGGIGRIWVARDRQLGRDVALKELRPDRAGNISMLDRFLREAQITGQLEHPGIIPVHELSRLANDDQPFYIMRLINGPTLTDAVRSYHEQRRGGATDSLKFLGLLNAFVAVCNTVAYAHSRGVIHRDLKGQNVVLGEYGDVLLLDWGLAKLLGDVDTGSDATRISLELLGSGSADLTADGQAIGTPSYMAPEQAEGRVAQIDTRTDVYGLGAMLYEILTGQPPFAGPDVQKVLRAVREEEPIPPRLLCPGVPPALDSACLRALAKRGENRFETATDLALAVQSWQEIERRQAEEALRQSEALYHSLVETLPICIWRKDRESRFTFANTRLCDGLGRSPDQVIGKLDFEFFPRDLAEKYRKDDARVIKTGKALQQVEEHTTIHGQTRHVEVNKIPIVDSHGEIIGTQGMFWDVTALKRAEEGWLESEERYRSVIAAIKEGIVLFTAGGDILACNSSAERILGLSAEQILERSARDPRWQAVREDGSPFPEDEFPVTVTLRTGNPCYDVVMGVQKPDDSLTWISINSQPLFRQKASVPYAAMASFSDITARKRLEKDLRDAQNQLSRLRAET
jgi:PAS domain S-box-containing protein